MPLFRLFDDLQPGEKQRVLWTLKESMLMLDVINEMHVIQPLCLKGLYNNCEEIYADISRRMQKQGCAKTAENVKSRWLTMRRLYIKEKKRRDATESSAKPSLSEEIFNMITNMLKEEVHLIHINKKYRLVTEYFENESLYQRDSKKNAPKQKVNKVTKSKTSKNTQPSPLSSGLSTAEDNDDDLILLPTPEESEHLEIVEQESNFYPLEVCLTVLDEEIEDFSDISATPNSSKKSRQQESSDMTPIPSASKPCEVIELADENDSEDVAVVYESHPKSSFSMPKYAKFGRPILPLPNLNQKIEEANLIPPEQFFRTAVPYGYLNGNFVPISFINAQFTSTAMGLDQPLSSCNFELYLDGKSVFPQSSQYAECRSDL